jgi:hypothetical protein
MSCFVEYLLAVHIRLCCLVVELSGTSVIETSPSAKVAVCDYPTSLTQYVWGAVQGAALDLQYLARV